MFPSNEPNAKVKVFAVEALRGVGGSSSISVSSTNFSIEINKKVTCDF
jgi:hypothetical protein